MVLILDDEREWLEREGFEPTYEWAADENNIPLRVVEASKEYERLELEASTYWGEATEQFLRDLLKCIENKTSLHIEFPNEYQKQEDDMVL